MPGLIYEWHDKNLHLVQSNNFLERIYSFYTRTTITRVFIHRKIWIYTNYRPARQTILWKNAHCCRQLGSHQSNESIHCMDSSITGRFMPMHSQHSMPTMSALLIDISMQQLNKVRKYIGGTYKRTRLGIFCLFHGTTI